MSHLDLAQIQELKEIMEEGFGDLVDAYLTDSEQKLIDLKPAIESQDFNQVADLAHSVKGASANIFAEQLAEHCRKVEDAGRSGDLTGISEVYEQILEEYQLVKDELQKF